MDSFSSTPLTCRLTSICTDWTRTSLSYSHASISISSYYELLWSPVVNFYSRIVSWPYQMTPCSCIKICHVHFCIVWFWYKRHIDKQTANNLTKKIFTNIDVEQKSEQEWTRMNTRFTLAENIFRRKFSLHLNWEHFYVQTGKNKRKA